LAHFTEKIEKVLADAIDKETVVEVFFYKKSF
jgi:hypothetical protein